MKKALAIYFPAFHRIPENDKWWGEGFTEWDNVRSGKPFFKGHYQPVVPADGRYYDLSNAADIQKQAELALQYGISGFLMYHYWFGNQKTLLSKPLELYRDEVTADLPYALCWANETWITTWHGKDPTELLRQEYGAGRYEEEWREHYAYMRSFFTDPRYILIDNKPLLAIYNASAIERYEDMVDFMNRLAEEDGFDGIYFLEYISSKNTGLFSQKSSAVTEFEPLYTTRFNISKWNLLKRALCKKLKRPDYQSFDALWRAKLKNRRVYGKPIMQGAFVGWDNSARKGKNSMIVTNATPEKFAAYLEALFQNRAEDSSEYVIINAWNEWSEGVYLEPDTKNGLAYLEALKEVMSRHA